MKSFRPWLIEISRTIIEAPRSNRNDHSSPIAGIESIIRGNGHAHCVVTLSLDRPIGLGTPNLARTARNGDSLINRYASPHSFLLTFLLLNAIPMPRPSRWTLLGAIAALFLGIYLSISYAALPRSRGIRDARQMAVIPPGWKRGARKGPGRGLECVSKSAWPSWRPVRRGRDKSLLHLSQHLARVLMSGLDERKFVLSKSEGERLLTLSRSLSWPSVPASAPSSFAY